MSKINGFNAYIQTQITHCHYLDKVEILDKVCFTRGFYEKQNRPKMICETEL